MNKFKKCRVRTRILNALARQTVHTTKGRIEKGENVLGSRNIVLSVK